MIVCINPWLDDFTAYDLWAKPVGLLEIYSFLQKQSLPVTYIDFLYTRYPDIPFSLVSALRARPDGRSEFIKTEIEKPSPYQVAGIPRHYYRYGLPEETARAMLQSIECPTLFFITSIMTYWYSGLHATIRLIREVHPNVPIVVGGIYATLCTAHAQQTCGADHVLPGNDYGIITQLIEKYTVYSISPATMDTAYDLDWNIYPDMKYIPLRFSQSCPYHCPYCAGPFLSGKYRVLSWEKVYKEFCVWYDSGIRHFALYDDAVLVDADTGIKPFLRRLLHDGRNAFFHTPNAMHVNLFDSEMAELASEARFSTLRFGFETVRREALQSEDKTDRNNMQQLAQRLAKEGFHRDSIRIYLIAGMPGQHRDEVRESIHFIRSLGLQPIVNEYSPVPHSKMFMQACMSSPYALQEEPLYHNNSIVACRWEGLTYDDMQTLKREARE